MVFELEYRTLNKLKLMNFVEKNVKNGQTLNKII